MQRFTYIFIVSFNHFSWYDPSPLPLTTRCEAAGISGYQPPPACDSHLPYQVGRRYKRRWPLPRNSPSRADRGGQAGRHTFHVCTRLQHQKQAICFLNFIVSEYGRVWHEEPTLGKVSKNQNGNLRWHLPWRGGGLEGVSSATYLFWKVIFIKNHLESFPDCENVFCT